MVDKDKIVGFRAVDAHVQVGERGVINGTASAKCGVARLDDKLLLSVSTPKGAHLVVVIAGGDLDEFCDLFAGVVEELNDSLRAAKVDAPTAPAKLH